MLFWSTRLTEAVPSDGSVSNCLNLLCMLFCSGRATSRLRRLRQYTHTSSSRVNVESKLVPGETVRWKLYRRQVDLNEGPLHATS
jgi:hypothetical protein